MVNLYPQTWMRRRAKISTEPPPWAPTDIDGCVLWLPSEYAYQDAAKTVPCVDSSLIWVGEDKNLIAQHDAIQATEAKRPTYLTDQLDGCPAWQGDLVDNFLATSNYGLIQPYTLFCVFQMPAKLGVKGFFDGSTVLTGLLYLNASTDGTPLQFYNGANYISTYQFTVGSWYCLTLIINGASSQFKVNNLTPEDFTTGSANPNGTYLFNGGDGTSYPSNHKQVDMIIYDSALSSGDVDLVLDNYIHVKYPSLW